MDITGFKLFGHLSLNTLKWACVKARLPGHPDHEQKRTGNCECQMLLHFGLIILYYHCAGEWAASNTFSVIGDTLVGSKTKESLDWTK